MEKHPALWIEYLARIGYVAKGVVYGTVGLLSIQEALDIGGKTTGSEGALRSIAAQPMGQVLLVLLIIGLVGYVVWRFVQAILDPEHHSTGLTDIFRRLGYATSAVFYSSLAFSAVKILALPNLDNDDGVTAQAWTARLLVQPLGRWLVGAVGLFIVGLGCYYFYRAIKAEFRKRFKLHEMSPVEKLWTTIVGRFGIAARGFVYVMIGTFAIQAAWSFDASKIETSEGALRSLENNPTDEWVLAIVAIGLISYALHMGFQARYRSIEPR
ncbi:MAG: DUF1206 domain-containing protein [Leptolyngbyaceae bacterium]|nr:DUF1206 domain-containing protein [Leptolyngbyaceae bacterium]